MPRTLLLLGVSLLALGVARPAAQGPGLYRESRRIMGTYCEVQAYHADATAGRAAATRALDEMQRIDRLLSNYDANSELSAMNRDAARAPFHASPELFDFVRQCRHYVTDTGGAFDPTVGPLVRAWGFFTPTPARPSLEVIAAARRSSGFDKVHLNEAAHTVSYATTGMEIDPGGIGKGLAVDRAADLLVSLGVQSALISAGGSTLYAIGHPPDRPAWTVSVRDPAEPDAPLTVVSLRDTAVSTSGVSEKFVLEGTRRLPHIFDPRTGEPVEGMCQTSVVAPTATASDALTKAAFILTRDVVAEQFRQRGPAFHALRVEGDCTAARTLWTTPWSAAVFTLKR